MRPAADTAILLVATTPQPFGHEPKPAELLEQGHGSARIVFAISLIRNDALAAMAYGWGRLDGMILGLVGCR
jgi:hypothetical protein